MQYFANALKKGDRAAVYTFDEVIDTLFDRSEKLCLGSPGGFRKFQADRFLHAQQIDAAELTAGAFAHEVRRVVEGGVKVIVIDSLNGYMNAMPEERFLITHLHELFAYLNQKGVVTIMVVAQHGLMVGGMSELDVSYLADTVMLFRYFEARGEIHQAVSVFKKRTGPHQRSVRQLKITATGLEVSPARTTSTGLPPTWIGRRSCRCRSGSGSCQSPSSSPATISHLVILRQRTRIGDRGLTSEYVSAKPTFVPWENVVKVERIGQEF